MVDESESRFYDERGAMARMLASEAAIAPEPFAIVLSTPSGHWFYVRCREHGEVWFSNVPARRLTENKHAAGALAARHNREHAREG